MTQEFTFSIGQKVTIKEIETIGKVRAIGIDRDGSMYKVVYFLNSKLEEVWLMANDLEAA